MTNSLRRALEYTKIYWEIHIKTQNLNTHVKSCTYQNLAMDPWNWNKYGTNKTWQLKFGPMKNANSQPPLLNTTFMQELIIVREEYTPIKITHMEIYKKKDIHPRKNRNIISIDWRTWRKLTIMIKLRAWEYEDVRVRKQAQCPMTRRYWKVWHNFFN